MKITNNYYMGKDAADFHKIGNQRSVLTRQNV